MYCLVSFTLFCRLPYATIVLQNDAFYKTNEIAPTQPKRLSTFVIDTQPYNRFLKTLPEVLRKAETAANSMEKFYD